MPRDALAGCYSTYLQLGISSWHIRVEGVASSATDRQGAGGTNLGPRDTCGRRLAPSSSPRPVAAAVGASASPSARARTPAPQPRTVRAWMADDPVRMRPQDSCRRPARVSVDALARLHATLGRDIDLEVNQALAASVAMILGTGSTADADERTQARPTHSVGERAGGRDAGWARPARADTALSPSTCRNRGRS